MSIQTDREIMSQILLALKNANESDKLTDFIVAQLQQVLAQYEGNFKLSMAYDWLRLSCGQLLDILQVIAEKGLVKHPVIGLASGSGRYSVYNKHIDHIVRATANMYLVSPDAIKGRRKSQSVVFPRQVAMYLVRSMLQYSYDEIGIAFCRHHTTILYACRKISRQCGRDSDLKSQLNYIREDVQKLYEQDTKLKLATDQPAITIPLTA